MKVKGMKELLEENPPLKIEWVGNEHSQLSESLFMQSVRNSSFRNAGLSHEQWKLLISLVNEHFRVGVSLGKTIERVKSNES